MQIDKGFGMTAATIVFIALNPFELLLQTVYSKALGGSWPIRKELALGTGRASI